MPKNFFLRPAEAAIVRVLGPRDRASVGEIAARSQLTASTVRETADVLLKRELVELVTSQEGSTLLALTPEGITARELLTDEAGRRTHLFIADRNASPEVSDDPAAALDLLIEDLGAE